MAMTAGKKAFAWCAASFTCVHLLSYFDVIGASPLILGQFVRGSVDVGQMVFFAVIALGFLCAVVFSKKLIPVLDYIAITAAAAGPIGDVLLAVANNQTLFPAGALCIAGCVCVGLCYTWLLIYVFDIIGLLFDTTQILYIALISTIALPVGQAVVSQMSLAALAIISAITSPIALVCARMAKRTGTPTKKPAPLQGRGERSLVWQLAILAFVNVAIHSATGFDAFHREYSEAAAILISALAFLVAIGIGLAIYKVTRKLAPRIYVLPPFVLVLVAGFIIVLFLLPLSETHGSRWVLPITLIVETYSEFLLVFATMSSLRILRYDSLQVTGTVYCLTWTSMLVANLLFGRISTLASMLIMAGAILLLFVLPLSFAAGHGQVSTAERCRIAAEQFGLTPRESEVLALLAQGRNAPRIQEELSISEGTARTHISHIYGKMNVQTRQELLDLLETL